MVPVIEARGLIDALVCAGTLDIAAILREGAIEVPASGKLMHKVPDGETHPVGPEAGRIVWRFWCDLTLLQGVLTG